MPPVLLFQIFCPFFSEERGSLLPEEMCGFVLASRSLPGTRLSFGWRGEEQGTGVSEIREISTQIKTFYQPLIAVQTNYIWAKLCQRLPRGIIIKI